MLPHHPRLPPTRELRVGIVLGLKVRLTAAPTFRGAAVANHPNTKSTTGTMVSYDQRQSRMRRYIEDHSTCPVMYRTCVACHRVEPRSDQRRSSTCTHEPHSSAVFVSCAAAYGSVRRRGSEERLRRRGARCDVSLNTHTHVRYVVVSDLRAPSPPATVARR